MAYRAPELIKGIITRLNAVSAVTDIVGTRIYTNVPDNAIFPYITVRLSATDNSTKDATRFIYTIGVQSYSTSPSQKETHDIHQALHDALARQESNITLDAGEIVRIDLDSTVGVVKDPDGVTWLQVSSFDVSVDN